METKGEKNGNLQSVEPASAARLQEHLKFWLWGAVLIVGAGLVLLSTPAGLPLIMGSYDWVHRLQARSKATEAVIVALDEESYRELKQEPKSFDRALFAQLVDRMSREGARAVVFDVLFADAVSGGQADARLAAAFKISQRVILAADLASQGQGGEGSDGFKRTVIPPSEHFVTNAAALGLNKFWFDADLAVRRHYTGPEWIGGLAWEAALLTKMPVTADPLRRDDERWLRYYSEGECFSTHSLHTVLMSGALPEGFFSNKVVFVGSRHVVGYAGDQRDFFKTPFGTFLPGVEVHATAFANLARGDWLRRSPIWLEALLLLAAGVGISWLAVRLPVGWNLVLSVGLAVGLGMVGMILSRFQNWWFPLLIPIGVQIPMGVVWSLASHGIRGAIQRERQALEMQRLKLLAEKLEAEQRSARLEAEKLELERKNLLVRSEALEASLGKLMPPARIKQLVGSPELLEPGAKTRELSILCSDIEIFSELTNLLTDEQVVRFLNDYYGIALGCLHEHNGTVIKLIGDAIFAAWNVPFDEKEERHEVLACLAGCELQRRLQQCGWEGTWKLNTRIGLHSGVAQVGNLGSRDRFEYTAIGRDVNLAFRLEGCNKHLETSVLASGRIYETVKQRILGRHVGNFLFQGFGNPVQVYELLGPREAGELPPPWMAIFKDAWASFAAKKYDQAEALFEEVIGRRGQDGPSNFYLKEIARRRASGITEEEKNGSVRISK